MFLNILVLKLFKPIGLVHTHAYSIEYLVRYYWSILTDFYMKPTNKDRILKYDSQHPHHQKQNEANTFMSRDVLFDLEIWTKNKSSIKKKLNKNGYPNHIIQQMLNRYDSERKNKWRYPFIGCSYINGLSENIKKLFRHCDTEMGIGHKPSLSGKKTYPNQKDLTKKVDRSWFML